MFLWKGIPSGLFFCRTKVDKFFITVNIAYFQPSTGLAIFTVTNKMNPAHAFGVMAAPAAPQAPKALTNFYL